MENYPKLITLGRTSVGAENLLMVFIINMFRRTIRGLHTLTEGQMYTHTGRKSARVMLDVTGPT